MDQVVRYNKASVYITNQWRHEQTFFNIDESYGIFKLCFQYFEFECDVFNYVQSRPVASPSAGRGPDLEKMGT